jgi:NAD(P)-dependent dehydrogenase (short-subunit alcohol dehydrogenase family)
MARRTAVVTGGSGGIGRAVVHRLSARGAAVVATGRTPSVPAFDDPEVEYRVCDAADAEQVHALFTELGRVDVLVNAAGAVRTAPIEATSLEDWNWHIDTNATTAFVCLREALPLMRRHGWGRVVMIASTAGVIGYPFTSAYSASKHAMVGLARAVAEEVLGTSITVNAVCPGYVRTPLVDGAVERIARRSGRDPEVARAAIASSNAMGRLLEPEEVADVVDFLTSEGAGAVNGQTLVVSGGNR